MECIALEQGTGDSMSRRRTISILLMIAGAAILVGTVIYVLDKATSTDPGGLGTSIVTLLGLLLGAITEIKGVRDWKKKETPSLVPKNMAFDGGQINTAEHGRNIQVKDSGQYHEQNIQADNNSVVVSNINVGPIGSDFIIGETKKDTARPYQLPEPPTDFTGRKELITELLADIDSHKAIMINGMGGVGKTTLGLYIAKQISNDYVNGQIYLDLQGTTPTPLSAMDIMRHVIVSLEPNRNLRELNEKEITNTYRSVLHGKQVLLFLDNAFSADSIEPVRPPDTCATIITSRRVFNVTGLLGRQHQIESMKEEDAKDFLVKICSRVQECATELARECAYLPLALRIAGSFLKVNDNWALKEYLDCLKDHRKRLPTLDDSRTQVDLSKDHPYLQATFELSYNQLSEEAQKHWRMLAVFSGTFDAMAAQAIWDLEKDTARRQLSLLRRYSLLDYDKNSSRYSLHDLLAEYACSQMDKSEEGPARISHAAHYAEVLGNLNQMFLRGKEELLPALRLYDLEWSNIEAGQKVSVSYLEQNQEAADACNQYAWQGSINNLRLKPKDQIKWIEDGLRAARVLENKKAEGSHLSNLGLAYADLGETRKAIEFYEQSLGIDQEIGDRRGEGADLGNLGLAYADLGETRKAIEFYEQSLVIKREIGDRRGEGITLFNVGLTLYGLEEKDRVVGQVKEALIIFEAIESPSAETARSTLKEWGALP
jgi:tetratricopeptide (TPR) repeat protein